MKLSLIKIIESIFHPAVPGPENAHQYRTKLIKKYRGTFPYENAEEDLENAEEAIEGMEESLFNFSQPSGPVMGSSPGRGGGKYSNSGGEEGFGKTAHDFGDYEPDATQDEEETIKKKLQILKGRLSTKVDTVDNLSMGALKIEAVGDRSKIHPRHDISTKQPWKNGLPTHDKKDLVVADIMIDLIDDKKSDDEDI